MVSLNLILILVASVQSAVLQGQAALKSNTPSLNFKADGSANAAVDQVIQGATSAAQASFNEEGQSEVLQQSTSGTVQVARRQFRSGFY